MIRSFEATSKSEHRADTGSRRTKNVVSQKPCECFKKEEMINSIKHDRKVEKKKD